MGTSEDYKYKKWMMTIMSNPKFELPEAQLVESVFEGLCSEFVFQYEVGEKGMHHYQCAIETKIRKRAKTLISDIASLTNHKEFLIQVDRSLDWEKAKIYCSAEEKRLVDTPVYTNIKPKVTYDEKDILILDDKEKRYPWQNKFMEIFFDEDEIDYKPCDGRSIHWITDSEGLAGKSTFVKWLHRRYDFNTKVSFGSATQIRTSVVEKGPMKMYFIDIPRTLGIDDNLNNTYSALEDTLNGYVETSMHGNPRELLMNPPHVIVFSNGSPNQDKLSLDRWKIYSINSSKELIFFHVL